jgi:hypothetical protein
VPEQDSAVDAALGEIGDVTGEQLGARVAEQLCRLAVDGDVLPVVVIDEDPELDVVGAVAEQGRLDDVGGLLAAARRRGTHR